MSVLYLSFLVSNKRYRASHLLHHRYVNTDEDPDLEVNTHPKSLAEFSKELAKDLLCMSLIKTIRRSRKFGVISIYFTSEPGFGTERVLFLAFVATLTAAIVYFHIGWQFLLYWVVPFYSFLQVLVSLRGYAEHAGRMDGDLLNHARTIDVGPIERVIFAPCNVNRHLEHHLYPSVPAHHAKRCLMRCAETRNLRAARSGRRVIWPRAFACSANSTAPNRRAPRPPPDRPALVQRRVFAQDDPISGVTRRRDHVLTTTIHRSRPRSEASVRALEGAFPHRPGRIRRSGFDRADVAGGALAQSPGTWSAPDRRHRR